VKSNLAKKQPLEISCGIFSKREAAGLIAGGSQHVHSTLLGTRDVCWDATQARIVSKVQRDYPWEEKKLAKTVTIHSSKERHDVIRQAVAQLKTGPNRDLREKVLGVLEELITNSIYHPYRNEKGEPKYQRSKPAFLSDKEWLSVRFFSDARGVFLSVTDQGGTLNFPVISRAFSRCYGDHSTQIEDKEGGAGLGVYMVFEAVTHLKITVDPGVSTEFSCWISDKKHFDPEYFSFNFFNLGKP
jgi:hypothetical protein